MADALSLRLNLVENSKKWFSSENTGNHGQTNKCNRAALIKQVLKIKISRSTTNLGRGLRNQWGKLMVPLRLSTCQCW